jgi:hypothetical protein
VKAKLYEQYWDPLYCYARRRGFAQADASDLAQGFLTDILLGREFLSKADRARGRFRSLLVKAFQNHIGNVMRKKKVPTGAEGDVCENPVHEAVPDDPGAAFDYAWATTILDAVLADLESECLRDGLDRHWGLFKERVMQPLLKGAPAPCLDAICRKYAVKSQHASNMIVTVKRRFRQVLTRHLTEQGDSQKDADEALADFLGVFSRM